MEKQTQLPFWLFGTAILAVVFHNFFSAAFQMEEGIFFSLALLLILAFVVSVVYVVTNFVRTGKPKDLWKLGWLGIFGLLGIFTPNLYGFFGFFGFFGLRKK